MVLGLERIVNSTPPALDPLISLRFIYSTTHHQLNSIMHRFAISVLYTLLPLVLADTSYMVSNVQFWQYNKSSNYIEEIIHLDAQGTTPGALRVDCDLTWNASAAAQVPATGPPLVEQFNCTDPAVNITMQRMTVNFFQPWYLTVSLK